MQSTDQDGQSLAGPPFLVVVGGSAGSIEALETIMARLPADLPAAVLVVVHLSPQARSELDEILNRAGPLPVSRARDGEPLRAGHVYVAPPDRHLTVRDGHVDVVYGPSHNRSRPAVDPLFTSAARFDGRVIAIILSGLLDDGTLGAMAIRDAGGTVIAQSHDDAMFASMPASVISYAGANYVLPAADIAPIVASLVSRGLDDVSHVPVPQGLAEEEEIAMHGAGPGPAWAGIDVQDVDAGTTAKFDEPFALICPECGGATISDVPGDSPRHFRCFLGHSFTALSLWHGQLDRAERALWTTLRSLEETAFLGHKLVDDARASEPGEPDARVAALEAQLSGLERQIEAIRAALRERPATHGQVNDRAVGSVEEARL